MKGCVFDEGCKKLAYFVGMQIRIALLAFVIMFVCGVIAIIVTMLA